MAEPLIIAEARMLNAALEKYAHEGWNPSEARHVAECVLLANRIVKILEDVTYANTQKPTKFEASVAEMGTTKLLELLMVLRRSILKTDLILKSLPPSTGSP